MIHGAHSGDAALGRKGRETRRRLMDAATRLLADNSPVALTAMAVAQGAGTAATTFYVYFRDVADLLYCLSEQATSDMLEEFGQTTLFLDRACAAEDSEAFLALMGRQWDRYGAILYYRMMEADRGHPRFITLRARWADAVLGRLTALLAGREGKSLGDEDNRAEAVVLFASVERLAGAMQREKNLPFSPARLRSAQVRVLTRIIAG